MASNDLLKPITKYTALILAAAIVFMLGTKIKKLIHKKQIKTQATTQAKNIKRKKVNLQ